MFLGGTAKVPELFQFVTYNTLVRSNLFKWQIFKGNWEDHQWTFTEKKRVAKNSEKVIDMEPGVLYYPVDPQFPAVDFVFVNKSQGDKKKQVFAIQVTFAENHQKPSSVYKKLYDRLGMNSETDEITIYIITQPKHALTYTKDAHNKMCKFKPGEINLHFAVVNCDWKF